MAKGPVQKLALLATLITCFTITTLVVIARLTTSFSKRKGLQLQCFFIYLAYVLYLAVWICYMFNIPVVFRVYAVSHGEAQPYPELKQDGILMQRLIMPSQVCFFTLLYCVKCSLLALYHNLLNGLPAVYRKIWLGIVLFVAAAWIGSLISMFVTCDSIKEQLKEGNCGQNPGELARIVFSLYFSYAADVATDVAVMVLPIRLTWNLQMPRGQKVGIMVLFCSGVVCIIFATLRVVQIGIRPDANRGTPEPKWLMLWTILEASIAVIVGCCPAFAVFIRGRLKSKKSSSYGYNNGYIQQSGGIDTFKMQSIITASKPKEERNSRLTKSGPVAYWDDAHSSQEELAKDSPDMRIMVTTTTKVSLEDIREENRKERT